MATELESDLHPNTASLAILTAILDRKGVMESDGSDKLPVGLFTAERLLGKIDAYLKVGTAAKNLPSNEVVVRRLDRLWEQGNILVEWGLLVEYQHALADFDHPEGAASIRIRHRSNVLL